MKKYDGVASSSSTTSSTERDEEEGQDDKSNTLYMFANVNIILSLFELIGKCPEYSSCLLDVEIDLENKKGFAQQINISCVCGWHHSAYTSEQVKSCGHTRYDVNTREIGKGYASIGNFCTVMNIPPHCRNLIMTTLSKIFI